MGEVYVHQNEQETTKKDSLLPTYNLDIHK